MECWGDEIPDSKVTGFDRAPKLKDDEMVVFSWVEWPDKRVRNRGKKAAMSDPRWAVIDPKDLPFDGKRMIYGGYRVLVES